MLINFDGYDLLVGIGILVALLPILWWQKRNLSYLLFFSIFWLYLLAVVQLVFFPFAIKTDSGGTFMPSINLIPFYFGSCFKTPGLCVRSIVDNVILTIPFGFGINFLVKIKPKNFFWLAITVGLGFELSQLMISLAFRSGFRAIDVNDAILNTTGVLLGYAFFRAFAWTYLKATDYFRIEHKWLFEDIYNIAFQAQFVGKSKDA